jgi:hypothetical protein
MSKKRHIRQDPDIMSLLSRLPGKTASSLTDMQLRHLKVAIGSGQYRKHPVDIRATLPLPFVPSRLYFVFLMGRNVRSLSRQEKSMAMASFFIMISLFLSLSTAMGLVILYLIKSALGINLLEGYSLGLWDWFKGMF